VFCLVGLAHTYFNTPFAQIARLTLRNAEYALAVFLSKEAGSFSQFLRDSNKESLRF
jgi:hypothetical protein